jgi:hypothetical protein
MDFADWKKRSLEERERLWQGYTPGQRAKLFNDFINNQGIRSNALMKEMPPEGQIHLWGLPQPRDRHNLWRAISPKQQLELWAAVKPEDRPRWWYDLGIEAREHSRRLTNEQGRLWKSLSDEQKQELFEGLDPEPNLEGESTAQRLIRRLLKYK